MPIRSRATTRYALDDRNRLVIQDPRNALHPRRLLEGRVRTDAKNRFIYEIETASARDGAPGPRTVSLDGTWALTDHHELALALHEAARPARHTLYLKGAVVAAETHALVFALRRQAQDDLRRAQRLSLSGRWAADAQNRLNFLVEKADGSEDRVVFQGGWEVGRHHELIYRYRQQDRTRRRRQVRELIFAGAWDITASDRLVYRLGGSSDSAFDFKTSLQSPSLHGRTGRLTYQLGIGLAGGRTLRRRISLFGAWKLNRDASVSFEVPYAEGRREAIRLNATYAFSDKNTVALELLDRRRHPLGLSVTFSRRFLEDAEWFVRVRKAGQDAEALAGVQVRF